MTGSTQAFRLSALAIVAGTVLALGGQASAQSRPEPEVKVFRFGGEDGKKGQVRVERDVVVRVDGDQPEVRVERRKGKAAGQPKRERRVIVLGDGQEGGGRTFQWRDGGEDGPKIRKRIRGEAVVIGPDGEKREFNFGDGEGMHEFHEDGGHIFRWRGEDGEDKPKMRVRSSGKAIIVGPDGERREFNFGDEEGPKVRMKMGEPGGQWREFHGGEGHGGVWHFGNEGHAPIIMEHLHRTHAEGQRDGSPRQFRMRSGGAGGVSGKVIIVGPDGERREFDLGGMGDGKGDHRIEIENHDGDGGGAHHEMDGKRGVKVRRVFRGGGTL
jgi:hypothetical protein